MTRGRGHLQTATRAGDDSGCSLRHGQEERAAEGVLARHVASMRVALGLIEHRCAPELLASTAEQLGEALRLEHVEVWLHGAAPTARPVSRWGEAAGPTERFPIRRRDHELGFLLVRARGGAVVDADRLLLGEFTSALALALTAAHGAHRLEQCLESREAERSDLRQDLHDRLGPTLTAALMRVETLGVQMRRGQVLLEHLVQIGGDISAALSETRRLARDLAPEALCAGSLATALELQAARFEGASGGGLRVEVDIACDLRGLSRAHELAAYQIVSESLTNVAKHAAASTCVIRLRRDHDLHVEVLDDGVGLEPGHRVGVGVTSMRERARRLLGDLVLERGEQRGTRVTPGSRWPPPSRGRGRGAHGANIDRRRPPDVPVGAPRAAGDAPGHRSLR